MNAIEKMNEAQGQIALLLDEYRYDKTPPAFVEQARKAQWHLSIGLSLAQREVSRRLVCCCCGGEAGKWKQHTNRDDGYGICAECIKRFRVQGRMTEVEIRDLYGVEGINFQPATATT
jgi:hypothetical protein